MSEKSFRVSKFGVGIVLFIVGLAFGYAGGALARPAAVASTTLLPTTTISQATMAPANVTMVVEGHNGGNLGSDNKTHDTFIPANFSVYAGQTVYLTVINYDEGAHSFTDPGLGVNFQIPGRKAVGVPSVSHFEFTAKTPGIFRWWCLVPCDDSAGGWAMTTGTGGQPDQVGFMAGFVTVLAPPGGA